MPWLLIIGGLAIIGLFGTVIAEAKHAGKLSGDLKASNQINADNIKTIEAERAARTRADGIAAAAIADAEEARKKYADRKGKIVNAPPSDDGPIAPVLRIALDGLRGPSPPAAAPGTNEGPHSGKPAGVPGRAGKPTR